jgi:hypothetical protein
MTIKERVELAALEYRLNELMPGFSDPVRKKVYMQQSTGPYQCSKCGAFGQTPLMRHYHFCSERPTGE